MIGSLRPGPVTVVGAGFAGLLIAEALDRRGREVTLIEAAPRAGGLIATRRTPLGLVEAAAHSILATEPVLALARELGVELVGVRPEARARFVLRGGKMRRFPLGPFEALGALFRALYILASRARPSATMTLDEWASRFLGPAARDYLIAPFVTGIFGARPGELDVASAFPTLVVPPGHSLLSYQLRKWRRRGFSRGPSGRMMAPRDGMAALTSALEARLEKRLGARFRRGERVERLPNADNLVVCVPADQAASLIPDEATSAALAAIEYAPLISVTVFVPRAAFRTPPRGVGVLIPAQEGRETLGILFDSSAFPERVGDDSRIALTAMLGGTYRPEVLGFSDHELEHAIRADLQAIFGIAGTTELRLEIHRWPRAIPIYGPAVRRALAVARDGWCAVPGRMLFGNYAGKVSLRGMIEDVAAMDCPGL